MLIPCSSAPLTGPARTRWPRGTTTQAGRRSDRPTRGQAMVSDTGRATVPKATLVSDTVLDRAALFFVSYDGVVNNNSFQQDAIVTHGGHQYATWYTGSRHAVVARR